MKFISLFLIIACILVLLQGAFAGKNPIATKDDDVDAAASANRLKQKFKTLGCYNLEQAQCEEVSGCKWTTRLIIPMCIPILD